MDLIQFNQEEMEEEMSIRPELWGRVFPENPYFINKDGVILKVENGKYRIIHTFLRMGDPCCKLVVNGSRLGFKVAWLLATAFIPNPLHLGYVRHLNGVKTDNQLENLQWITKNQPLLTPEQRFWGMVRKKEGCWEWTGYKNPKGYGYLMVKAGKPTGAHRFSYELHKGPIPKGLFVCHTCDNPVCSNPDHLFLGTVKDNTQDMVKKGRSHGQRLTHCKRGHELSYENTYHNANSRGIRVCRKCQRIRRLGGIELST
ncbi:HNH endonuclease [Hymenobacter sp. M29]|uniref:HNH endonuclease n=1 Tax=Hymenobacter mellowenesis TaxID=3063995 RepID=A0ABT9AEK2_9BACT|nr:HNH endonuclease [Hymenobacter sp. M29]MDO7847580.1 HNH endonuclease [Hymenobacter sp. M29]